MDAVHGWEYKQLITSSTHDAIITINRYGELGWELVSVVSIGDTGTVKYFLKRSKMFVNN